MSTTYELIIYGKVQHVGFRDKIENIGKILGIDGIIYNYKDGTVRILVNFDSERKKKLFKELIKELEEVDNLIKIEKIEEKELNTFIEFPEEINRISADDLLELNKKLDEGVKYIKLIFGSLEKLNVKIDKQTEILEKLNTKVDRQTEILEKLNVKMDKQTEILNNQTKILENLTEKIDKQTELLTESLNRLKEEMKEIKEILKQN
ncbi:acylphosphatase [Methanotorris igneus]|uniref:acylphosphatase n=1 Tax=Methanotorris igneus (strain DSM 5666 / JCM 11834 / Kol 5) TaxID=880724 RepID=F6BC82_METIK|nr:acylphosphatase [Methanotorris igneus]AEF97288.1 acylphosphatase [Methanotorris igneus Kol 5]